jgi:mycothiol synthase
MDLHGPVSNLDDTLARRVLALANQADLGVGHTSITEPRWRTDRRRTDHGFVASWAEDGGELVAFGQAVRTGGHPSWAAEVLIHPDRAAAAADLGASIVGRILRFVERHGGGHVHYWAAGATAAHEELAARCGLSPHRSLHLMHRPLPADAPAPLALRPFVRGQDEEAVLAVNAAAFASHPDQGGMSRDALEDRLDQSWFDADGFLLHERDGRVAGFCWTKVFAGTDPLLGEIHIICVHPDFVGHGLGKALVLAGLGHLFSVGAKVGMLFVEAENQAALDLYRGLGFEVVRTDKAFATTI